MTRDEVAAKLKHIIAEQICISSDQVKDTSEFINDLGCDSLDVVELMMYVEEEFDVFVDDEDAEKIKTVSDAIDLILKTREKGGA